MHSEYQYSLSLIYKYNSNEGDLANELLGPRHGEVDRLEGPIPEEYGTGIAA